MALPQRANAEINCIVAKHWPISRNLCPGPDRRPRMQAIWKDCARDAKAQSIVGLEARRRRNRGKIRRSANLRTILPGCGGRKRLHRRNHLLRLFRLLIEAPVIREVLDAVLVRVEEPKAKESESILAVVTDAGSRSNHSNRWTVVAA